MFIRVLMIIVISLLVVGGLAFAKFDQFSTLMEEGESFAEPPTTISSFEVKSDTWQSSLSSIGTLEAARGLIVTADLSGRVAKIGFKAGQEVKAGDLLIEQDTSSEKAQLRAAQASADLARSTLTRIQELYQKRVASKSELDDAQSSYQSSLASVDNIRATVEKKKIRAPFDGRLGIRLVNLGQTINAGEPVVSLQATNKMYINFSLPQQFLSQIETDYQVEVVSDAVPGKVFAGAINAIDPEIDSVTRTVKAQALLDNPEQELLPGMFASIKVIQPEEQNVLLIPVTAVQYATFGDSVFIIEPKKADESETEGQEAEEKPAEAQEEQQALQARQQFVKLGETRGDFIAVEKGLEVGQLVASAGAFKLRNGASVAINNEVVPDFQLNPEVEDK